MSVFVDGETMSLTDLIRLQEEISRTIHRRFERTQAIAFTDIVGCSAYFARFGDEAGRALHQRHFDLLEEALAGTGGRVVDTAGDGALLCFSNVDVATDAMVSLQRRIREGNASLARERQFGVRVGVHWGPVLTDGTTVTGDAVNVCSRLTAAAAGAEILISREAFVELGNASRVRCRPFVPIELKGIPRPVLVSRVELNDLATVISSLRIEETGEEIVLPARDIISFGRFGQGDRSSLAPKADAHSGSDAPPGADANDVVLSTSDERKSRLISRWHFELRRRAEGYVLRAVSDRATEVDGVEVRRGEEVPIRPGSVVRVSHILTLTFKGIAAHERSFGEATLGSTS